MEPLGIGQSWSYRPPLGFEASRIIIGAVVPMSETINIICCSVIDAPRHAEANPGDVTTIAFLPMTEPAFRASVVAMDGSAPSAASFEERFSEWVRDTGGLAAFAVPYTGCMEQMMELEFNSRERPQTGGGQTEKLISEIGKLLASGLETQTEPFPATKDDFDAILQDLRNLEPFDVFSRLVIGGFVNHPYGPEKQRCLECIYFLPHRSWCDLPEIDLPVESYWWCRLWRV